MQTVDIHGTAVHIDPDSDSAKVAAEFLTKNPDEAKAFFEEARRDLTNGVAHFEIPHTSEHTDISHHFTLIHNSDGTFNLRRRTGY
jgi:hypothetical protein